MLTPLLSKVWEWIGEEVITELKSFGKQKVEESMKDLRIFMEEKVPEWKPFVKEAAQKGLDWGLRRLEDMKVGILEKCRRNLSCLRATFKLGAKSLARTPVQSMVKNVARFGVRGALKSAAYAV